MSFLTLAALAVGLLIAAPFVAHLLKRGQSQLIDFPAVRWAPKRAATSPKRSRLEDRLLLSVRAAMVLALAVLGATPLLTCSRLTVARPAGGNVALAIVLDDSASMRSVTRTQSSRFELAKAGALELVRSTRQGDSIAIVAAGTPARLLLNPTGDLELAERTLKDVDVSDRATDLANAIRLSRATLLGLPQADRRVIVLSDLAGGDLAGGELPEGEPPAWFPLPELREAQSNCGVASAQARGGLAQVTVGCSTAQAATDRKVLLVNRDGKGLEVEDRMAAAAGEPRPDPTPGSNKTDNLGPRSGVQVVSLPVPEGDASALGWRVKLSGSDDNPTDDDAPLSSAERSLSIAIVSDPGKSGDPTAGRGLIETALAALDPDLAMRPLGVPPDDIAELDAHAALILDDPPGLSPEARSALIEWLSQRGGVALALLGPASAGSQLASNLLPFADGRTPWEPSQGLSIKPESVEWLGEEGRTLLGLVRAGRLRLDGAVPKGASPLGAWEDDVPWLFEQTLGRGKAITCGLPVSLDESDLAVRPGFLALLAHVIEQAELRRGPRRSPAGSTWKFPGQAQVSIDGPGGSVPLRRVDHCTGRLEDGCGEAEQVAELALAGRYRVNVEGREEERVVTIEPDELVELPGRADAAPLAGGGSSGASAKVDVSQQVAFALLALFALELAIRAFSRARLFRGQAAVERV